MAKAAKKAKRKKPVITWMVEEKLKSGRCFRHLRKTRSDAREMAKFLAQFDATTARVARVRITEL